VQVLLREIKESRQSVTDRLDLC